MALDPSYNLKTLDELQAEFVQLGNDLSVIDTKRKDILALIEKKEANLFAEFNAGNLSAAEKAAVKALLFSRVVA